ncbi:GTPase Obg [Folsomia candida]|uniref:GTPase Obg n=1 Tax=Folsomia candida TaxID=158441 RepID=A0A226EBN7_FOLCA|nr:GTPase Obg [Folsomia candida]
MACDIAFFSARQGECGGIIRILKTTPPWTAEASGGFHIASTLQPSCVKSSQSESHSNPCVPSANCAFIGYQSHNAGPSRLRSVNNGEKVAGVHLLFHECGASFWPMDQLDLSMLQAINSAMQFETRLIKGNPNLRVNLETKVIKLFIHISFYSVIGVAAAILGLTLMDPCSPPFLLSMKSDCASIKWITHFGLQHVVLIFETWMNVHSYVGGSLEVFYTLVVGIVCILNYFEVLRRNVRHAEGAGELKACIEVYRGIQILEKLFNNFLMDRIVPGMLLLMPALQVLTQYVSVMMHEDIPMPLFLVFPIIWLNTVTNNILIFTLASWVNNTSTKVLKEQRSSIVKQGFGAKRSTQVKACTVLKIKFGSNFLDRGTPLVIQDFCLNTTLSLILISSALKGH